MTCEYAFLWILISHFQCEKKIETASTNSMPGMPVEDLETSEEANALCGSGEHRLNFNLR